MYPHAYSPLPLLLSQLCWISLAKLTNVPPIWWENLAGHTLVYVCMCNVMYFSCKYKSFNTSDINIYHFSICVPLKGMAHSQG